MRTQDRARGLGRPPRASALAGWALAAAVALWWLAGSALALDRGADAGRFAGQAAAASLLVRTLALLLLGLRVGAVHGGRAGSMAMLLLTAPSWPVSLLTWLAGTAPPLPALMGELGLVGAALLLPRAGAWIGRVRPLGDHAEAAATCAGAALAAACWAWRDHLPL